MEKQIEKLTFKNIIMSIGVLPSSYVDSMSYYETLVWLCHYLENTVIPAVNNNGEAVEELQTLYQTFTEEINTAMEEYEASVDGQVQSLEDYMNNYFDNLDVQEEVNNKLNAMALDGTLEHLINDDILNGMKKSSPNLYVTPTFVTQISTPTGGYYIQSWCNDGTYTYIFFTNGTDVIVRKYAIGDYSDYLLENNIGSGHANSACMFNNYIYVCNYTSQNKIDIVDPSDLTILKSITSPIVTRAFSIFRSVTQNQIMVCIQRYENNELRYYQIMPNNKLEARNIIPMLPIRAARNAIKHIVYNQYDCIMYCMGSGANWKGNTIAINTPNTNNTYYVCLSLKGITSELQDVMQINSTLYLIDGDGNIYSTSLENFFPATWTGGVFYAPVNTQASPIRNDYYQLDTLDSLTDTTGTYNISTKFYIPPYLCNLKIGFMNGASITYTISQGNYQTAVPGPIYLPVQRTKVIGTNLYILSGYIPYAYTQDTTSNPKAYSYDLVKTQECFTLITIPTNLTGSISSNRYTYNGLISALEDLGAYHLLGNIYPVFGESSLPYGKTASQDVSSWITYT